VKIFKKKLAFEFSICIIGACPLKLIFKRREKNFLTK